MPIMVVGVRESSEGGFDIHHTFQKDVLAMNVGAALTVEAKMVMEPRKADRV
jgi:hypothetical protein